MKEYYLDSRPTQISPDLKRDTPQLCVGDSRVACVMCGAEFWRRVPTQFACARHSEAWRRLPKEEKARLRGLVA